MLTGPSAASTTRQSPRDLLVEEQSWNDSQLPTQDSPCTPPSTSVGPVPTPTLSTLVPSYYTLGGGRLCSVSAIWRMTAIAVTRDNSLTVSRVAPAHIPLVPWLAVIHQLSIDYEIKWRKIPLNITIDC